MGESIYKLFSEIKQEKDTFCPLTAELDVTLRCPCKCVHCYQEHNRLMDRAELTTNEIFKYINDLHDLGTFECIVSGGDPLCRDDIWDILAHLKSKRIRTVLYTSGYLLSEEACKKICELKIARVEMTLLGSTAAMHDRISRTEGAFARIISSTTRLKEYGIPVRLKYMLLHANYSGMADIKKIEEDLHQTISIIPYLWCKQGGNESEIACMRINEKEMDEYFKKYPFTKRENTFFSCNAGKYKISIDALGNIKPCSAFAINCSIGNIRKDCLKEVWFTNKTLIKMRNTIRYPNAECRRCEKSEYCSLCPAISTWEGKEFADIYSPMCIYAESAKRNANEKI